VRLPDSLFAIINPIVRFLLRSPFHRFWSGSLLLITFTGRNSGREFTTPVRYVRVGDAILCFTSAENQWWRNLRDGKEVILRLQGKDRRYRATLIHNDPPAVRKWLGYYLEKFPQDAAYHDIRINRDGTLVAEDLERASSQAVVVEATPI
jgi:hypothetical protein